MGSLAALVLAVAPSVPRQEPAAPDTAGFRIKLPFLPGTTETCDQGFGGSHSHRAGTRDEFAWDFRMHLGMPVLAAAPGRVIDVKDDSTVGGPDKSFARDANYIWIDHGRGLYTLYSHLLAASSAVRPGQLVNGGQMIAKSGSTGFVAGPHLHFAVTDCRRQTLPAAFVECGTPGPGAACLSANDGRGCSAFAGDSPLSRNTFGGHIRIDEAIPATCFDWSREYTLKGSAPNTSGVVLFFARGADPGAVALKRGRVDRTGSFEIRFGLKEFPQLAEPGPYKLGLASEDAERRFRCEEMIACVLVGQRTDRPLLNLPFKAAVGAVAHVDGAWNAPGGPEVVCFALPAGSAVLAPAAGRVVAVGEAQDLPVAFPRRPRRCAYVTVDHGFGILTTCFGLDPDGVRVASGQILGAGAALGASKGSPLLSGAHAGFLVHDPLGRPATAGFGELVGGELASGRVCTSANDGSNPWVFARDSLLPADAFKTNGVVLSSSPAAHTFWSDVASVFEGVATRPASKVALLVRERGSRTARKIAEAAIGDERNFVLGVQMPEQLAPDELEYTLMLGGDELRLDVPRDLRWVGLCAMR